MACSGLFTSTLAPAIILESPIVFAAVNLGIALIVPVPPIPPPPPAVSIILPLASTSKLNVGVPVIAPDP